MRRKREGVEAMLLSLTALVEAGASDLAAGRKIGLTKDQVRYLRRQCGLASNYASGPAPAPEDFHIIASGKRLNEAARHYGVAWKTARRWAMETKAPVDRSTAMRNVLRRQRRKNQAVADAPDTADQAATYLRRYTSVFRCDILLFVGKPDTLGSQLGLSRRGKGWWMVTGKGPMEREALIALAEAKGFKA